MYLFKRIPLESSDEVLFEGFFLKFFTFWGWGLKFLSLFLPCRPPDELFFEVISKIFAKLLNISRLIITYGVFKFEASNFEKSKGKQLDQKVVDSGVNLRNLKYPLNDH